MRPHAAVIGLALVVASATAIALPICDSQEKMLAFYADVDANKGALKEKRFADLDRKLNALLGELQAGRITDTEVDRVFARLFARGLVADEPLHQDWIAAFPKSRAAFLAAAYDYRGRGLAARTADWASKVSDAQFAAMRAEFEKAHPMLDEVDALGPELSLTEAVRVDMRAHAGDITIPVMESRIQRDLKRFPRSVQLRVVLSDKTTPKWGGSLEMLASVEKSLDGLGEDDRRYIHYLVLEHTADAYAQIDRFDDADRLYRQSLPLCPGLDRSLENLVAMLTRAKRYEPLVSSMDIYLGRWPRSGWGYTKRAWAEGQLDRWKDALHDYERAAALDYGAGYKGVAWIYATGHGVTADYARAAELFDKAAEKGEPGSKEQADWARHLLAAQKK